MMKETTSGNKISFLKRFWWVGLVIIILLIVIIICVVYEGNHPGSIEFWEKVSPQITDKVIIANVTDLSEIKGITKFRSCFGHEFGFTSGFDDREAKSSMKHYFVWDEKYTGQENTVPIYAPFDGKILITELENDQVLIEQEPFSGWVVTFTHVVLLPQLNVGSEVKAGELIAYAEMKKTHAFDVALQANKVKQGVKDYDWYNNYESIFNHMSDDVQAEYEAYGITKENIIISKSDRDKEPCICGAEGPSYPDSPYCNFLPIPFDQDGNGLKLEKTE